MTTETGPFVLNLSFRLLKEKYEELAKHGDKNIKEVALGALEIFEDFPELADPIDSSTGLSAHAEGIDKLMATLFPPSLGLNEIKSAVYPYTSESFYDSMRLRNIKADAVENMNDKISELFQTPGQSFNFIPYALILNQYYKFTIDFSRPLYLRVQHKNNRIKTYRVQYNADFLDIYPNENAIEITEAIVVELLAKAHDPELWLKYFPPNSWTIEGFGIMNFVDVTIDDQIDDFKTHLIQPKTEESYERVVNDIRKIFGIPDLQVGINQYQGDYLIPGIEENMKSFSVEDGESIACASYACESIEKRLFSEHQPVVLSNIEQYHENCGGNHLSKILLKNGIKSIILIPILVDGELSYIMELGAKHANQLNAINFVKLDSLLPFIQSHAKRSKQEYENQISAIIQRECTSIHPSVQWRFEQEAIEFMKKKQHSDFAVFEEIVFENVMPMFGQIDIVGSSMARNEAIRDDLLVQLEATLQVLDQLYEEKPMPLIEHIKFQAKNYIELVDESFHSNTEQEVAEFFRKQVLPVLKHANKVDRIESVKSFLGRLDADTNSIYQSRKEYNDTIDAVNEDLSLFLDLQQVRAQNIFPHYFEKFKTDGIEHNLYVGQSIVRNKNYHSTVLSNLRLWQLQVICEMEELYYRRRENYPVQLDVASLIFAYDSPITIRYRIDEKQFDVDGAYNVRYEMIKKRIDKSHIKGTNERITQPHKICVVYSNPVLEKEYMNYIEFLQSKNYIGKNVEKFELEELQGASGLRAIRADINPNFKSENKIFTVDDLEAVR